jgi:histidine triad (HIT) family protein
MSLAGDYDDNNIFAKILRGEMPAVKVTENADALAFMDVFPQSRGHVLVVPKNVRARNVLELPTDRIGPLMAQVQRVARAVAQALTPDGIQIMQFNGAPAGQTVYHLHVHVIPRYEGAPLKGHGHGEMADRADLEVLAQAIAAALD